MVFDKVDCQTLIPKLITDLTTDARSHCDTNYWHRADTSLPIKGHFLLEQSTLRTHHSSMEVKEGHQEFIACRER